MFRADPCDGLPEARRFFDGLSSSNETRERRVRQAAVMLREGRERG